ncbi:MAG: TM0106 family RecB-like putative nuclease [Saprospiraceae bacterium]|nr:TM0106 family RecB-like putative nuclease [Saprospiraceae bacterium]
MIIAHNVVGGSIAINVVELTTTLPLLRASIKVTFRIRKNGINQLEKYATKAIDWKIKRGNLNTYLNLQEQAQLQLKGRKAAKSLHEFLSFKPDQGLGILPAPSPGDVFFDIESDRFLEGGGLEYLFGVCYNEDDTTLQYQPFWALNRKDEKGQYEALMDWIMQRMEQWPDMHIYHFHHYEKTALKRLMGRYDSRAVELDLLRGEVMVDLHKVVKESLRASVESYSLKDLEVFYDFERAIPLPEAGWALRAVQKYIEFGDGDAIEARIKEPVQKYNEDDCRSTFALRNWLEKLRNDWIEMHGDLSRPTLKEPEANDKTKARDVTVERLATALRAMLPENEMEWTEQHQALQLMSDLVGYHRREEKSKWWEYYRLIKLAPEDLLEERNALAHLQFMAEVGGTDKKPIHRYTFPFRELGLKKGDKVNNLQEVTIGQIEDISYRKNM